MTEFKSAIIGVSARAAEHAEAYRHVPRASIVASCSRRPTERETFARRYAVPRQYDNYQEMIEKERPDLLHVVTPPDVRIEVLRCASSSAVPAVLMEKPLGTDTSNLVALTQYADVSSPKVVVNHQLHFHQRMRELRRKVQDGALGDIALVEASARHNLAYQGTHLLQAIRAFMRPASPAAVMGQVAGAAGLDDPHHHWAPDDALAQITFDGGQRAFLRCGHGAPASRGAGSEIYKHKRIAVYGDRGHVRWSMNGWETFIDGQRVSGTHDYVQEDLLAQAALTNAVLDWIVDEQAQPSLDLASALEDFGVMLGIYASALERTSCPLPFAPNSMLLPQLRGALQ